MKEKTYNRFLKKSLNTFQLQLMIKIKDFNFESHLLIMTTLSGDWQLEGFLMEPLR